jgi:hypothetical protein
MIILGRLITLPSRASRPILEGCLTLATTLSSLNGGRLDNELLCRDDLCRISKVKGSFSWSAPFPSRSDALLGRPLLIFDSSLFVIGYLSLELRFRDLLALFGGEVLFKSLKPTG